MQRARLQHAHAMTCTCTEDLAVQHAAGACGGKAEHLVLAQSSRAQVQACTDHAYACSTEGLSGWGRTHWVHNMQLIHPLSKVARYYCCEQTQRTAGQAEGETGERCSSCRGAGHRKSGSLQKTQIAGYEYSESSKGCKRTTAVSGNSSAMVQGPIAGR